MVSFLSKEPFRLLDAATVSLEKNEENSTNTIKGLRRSPNVSFGET